MYLKQLLMKNLRLHSRHKQQEFIAAITNQNIIPAYHTLNCHNRCLQHKVTRMMSIGIIIRFKIVQIYHRNSGILTYRYHLLLEKTPIISPCQ